MKSLLELREAAMQCSNLEYRYLMFEVADEVDVAIKELVDKCSEAAMQRAQCAWVHAKRIFESRPGEGDPAPLAGSPEPAKLAMAA